MSNEHQQRNTRYNLARQSGIVDPQDSFSVVEIDNEFWLNRDQRDNNLFKAIATKDGTAQYFDNWKSKGDFNPFTEDSLYKGFTRKTGTAFYGGLRGSGSKPEDKFVAEHLPITSGEWPDGTGKRGNFIDAAQSGVANSPVARYDFDAFKYKSPDNQEKDIDIRTGSISGVLTTITERTSAPDIGSSYNPDDTAPEFNEPSPVDPQQPPEEEQPPEENGPSPPSEDWLDDIENG